MLVYFWLCSMHAQRPKGRLTQHTIHPFTTLTVARTGHPSFQQQVGRQRSRINHQQQPHCDPRSKTHLSISSDPLLVHTKIKRKLTGQNVRRNYIKKQPYWADDKDSPEQNENSAVQHHTSPSALLAAARQVMDQNVSKPQLVKRLLLLLLLAMKEKDAIIIHHLLVW